MVVEGLVLEGVVPKHGEDPLAQTLVAEAVRLALAEVEHLERFFKLIFSNILIIAVLYIPCL